MNDALKKMREPFPPNQVSQMCRSTKKDNPKGSCPKCKGWHGLPAIQLEYVGHAALTDRLLEADPAWSWTPMALDAMGYPAVDKDGGIWINLTVGGVTRPGYGDAQGKIGGDAMKERIGDALRNAAMRFGAALDLWHKGDLHVEEGEEPKSEKTTTKTPPEPAKTALTETQAKYFPRIKAALDALHGTDTGAKKATIKAQSAIPKSDKYPAKEGIEDYRNLDGQRLDILAHKIEKLVPKQAAGEPAICAYCNKTGGHEPLCPEHPSQKPV